MQRFSDNISIIFVYNNKNVPVAQTLPVNKPHSLYEEQIRCKTMHQFVATTTKILWFACLVCISFLNVFFPPMSPL